MTEFTHDRKAIARLEKQARQAAARRADVTRSIMSTTQGREWMWDVLASCRIFGTTFAPDPYQSAFSEGERNVGLRLLADIMLNCPDQFIQAQREANERSSIESARADADERRRREEPDGRDSGPSDDAPGPAESTGGDYDPYSEHAARERGTPEGS